MKPVEFEPISALIVVPKMRRDGIDASASDIRRAAGLDQNPAYDPVDAEADRIIAAMRAAAAA